jgi:hypothetical protein
MGIKDWMVKFDKLFFNNIKSLNISLDIFTL